MPIRYCFWWKYINNINFYFRTMTIALLLIFMVCVHTSLSCDCVQYTDYKTLQQQYCEADFGMLMKLHLYKMITMALLKHYGNFSILIVCWGWKNSRNVLIVSVIYLLLHKPSCTCFFVEIYHLKVSISVQDEMIFLR